MSTTLKKNDYKGILSTASAVAFIGYLGYQFLSIYNDNKHDHDLDPKLNDNNHNWNPSQTLFLKAFIAALTSGLGGFPLYLVGELPSHIMGFAITFAAGLMSGCSVVLYIEALEFESSLLYVTIYTIIGMLIIHGISHLVGDIEDFEFAGLTGKSASKALLIVLSMGLHSLGEGVKFEDPSFYDVSLHSDCNQKHVNVT